MVHLYWGLIAQKQRGNKKVSEATALPMTVTRNHSDAFSPTKAVSSRCCLPPVGLTNAGACSCPGTAGQE